CVFLIYWCGRKLWGRAEGFLVALVAATSIGSFAFARAASMDMLLTACLTAALVFFLFTYNDPTPRRRICRSCERTSRCPFAGAIARRLHSIARPVEGVARLVSEGVVDYPGHLGTV